MVIETALLAGALIEVAKKLAEKAVIDPALEAGLEPFTKWLKGGLNQKKAEKELQTAFDEAIQQMGAPKNDDDKLLIWLQGVGLDRLRAGGNAPLRRQVALALVGFTDEKAPPPESLMIALGWPRSGAAELSKLLAKLRTGLANTSWKPMIDFANEASKKNVLKEILGQVTRFNDALVHTPEGDALRVIWIEKKLDLQQAADIEAKYRRNILLDFENMEMRGLSPQLLTSKPDINPALKSLPLESVYLEPGLIPLRSEREREVEWDEMLRADDKSRLISELRQQQKRVSDSLAGSNKLVIVGKPGSGKTVSLKFIALMLARGQAGAARLRLNMPYLPVYVRLAQFAERLKKEKDSQLSLEKFLMDSIGPYYSPGEKNFADFVQLALDKGFCMLLLDGLDEVGDVGDTVLKGKTLRTMVLEEVQRFTRLRCNSGCQNRILVTSRLEGYHRGDLRDFDEMELSALTMPDEVSEFLLRWFAAHEQKNNPGMIETEIFQRAQSSVVPLMSDILRSASVQRLAINPLLLTILAMIHKLGTRLPNERVRLYQIVTQTMIESWRQAQTRHNILIYDVMPSSRVTPMMASLAYWVHENQPGGAMPESRWRDEIKRLLIDNDDELKPDKADDLAEMFMRHAREEVGLLIERSPGQIGFFHLTLEEYLAGVDIAAHRESERHALVKKHWVNPRWREVLLLSAGQLMINTSKELNDFVIDLRNLDDLGNPELAGLPALLAGKAISDVGPEHFTRKVVRETRAELVELSTSNLKPELRAECADLADELGHIPADLHSFIALTGQQFAIGKYPVTNVQYERFLKAENFVDESYWTGFLQFDKKSMPLIKSLDKEVGDWTRRQEKENGILYPTEWRTARFGVLRPNAPVVGVSWYEANAYCKWLLAHWDELDEGKQGFPKPAMIRLPTEEEWVIAAGGEQNGRFAFGEKPDKEISLYANTSESGINRTTPVWMYPQGESFPHKLMDMSGNVFEWQANYWEKSHEYLALRGGSWSLNEDYARVSYRNVRPANYGDDDIGFRVVVFAFPK